MLLDCRLSQSIPLTDLWLSKKAWIQNLLWKFGYHAWSFQISHLLLSDSEMTSTYMKNIAMLAGRIFVDVGKPTTSKSKKIVRIFKEKSRADIQYDWYPPLQELSRVVYTTRDHGLFRAEHIDFKEEMKRLRALRGKTKPLRGEGKRSQFRNEWFSAKNKWINENEVLLSQ